MTDALKQAAFLAAEHTGMRVDYSGMLKQARDGLRREPAQAEMLRQLGDHLRELGDRYYAGDVAAVDEFLQLYCISSDGRRAALSTTPQAAELEDESDDDHALLTLRIGFDDRFSALGPVAYCTYPTGEESCNSIIQSVEKAGGWESAVRQAVAEAAGAMYVRPIASKGDANG